MRISVVLAILIIMLPRPAIASENPQPRGNIVRQSPLTIIISAEEARRQKVKSLMLGEEIFLEDGEKPSLYPKTEIVNVSEKKFGVEVADPYRWLEADVRNSTKVAKWVKAQNRATQYFLGAVGGRDKLAEKMRRFYNHERFDLPRRSGKYYFFTKNDGLQNQSILYARKTLSGKDRILIDPNLWSKDGHKALADWEPSAGGKYIAFSVQDGGSDWRTIQIINAKTGQVLPDKIKWAKFTDIAWVGKKGFFYSRFPMPEKGGAFQSLNFNHSIYFHKIGTAQREDRLVYATPDRPKLGHVAQVTHDGRWAVITSSRGTDERHELHIMPLRGRDKWTAKPMVTGFDHDWQLVEGMGDKLYFVTDKDAPKRKLVRAFYAPKCDDKNRKGCAPPQWHFTDLVAEREDILSRARIVGQRLILSYMKDAKSVAIMASLSGEAVQELKLNNIGTASGFVGKPGDKETFYRFSSFNQPGAIYRLDSDSGESSLFSRPELGFDPDNIIMDQHFYRSKDGTKIPMFIVHKKGLDLSKGAPTLLYGYGGFGISQTPSFDPRKMAWIDAGGVYALAGLRGGGEYGKAWHDAGRLLNKQNVFDDFAAAAEYLIAKGYTTNKKLAIEGRSNGGLLVAASVNQRPELFAAAHAAVGVMDMLRFDRFTAGRYWVDDYGYPDKEADFKNLHSYSPYHNIKSGAEYPAIIVSTADTDDRVVPGHSFKYISALQAADTGWKTKLIRIETAAGHGSGKPIEKLIEEYADIYGYLAFWTGLHLSE